MTNVYVNDAYLPYLNAKQRTQVFYGGSSSGKSFFLAQRAVLDNLQGANYLVCRNVAQTIKGSVYNEITKAINSLGLAADYNINRSDRVITCKRNNKQILFAGLDDVEKLKSITPVNGVIERIWVEEATEVSYESYKQLKKRLRGLSRVSKAVILSFNPVLKSHWIVKELFGKWEDSKTKYEDEKLLIVKTTYRDNAYLTKEDVAELEDETDPYFKDVYTNGNWGILGNVIYRNWRVEDLSDFKKRADNIYSGCDFGYTNPNAFIRVHVDTDRKKIYVLDELYKRGQSFSSFADDIKQLINRNDYVTGDSEDPRAIAEMNQYGVRMLPARKGPDSVLYGIKWLQGYEIIIDVHCQNLKNEIQAYHWQEDKEGNPLEKPVKKLDHILDALRYAVETLTRGKAGALQRF